MGTAALIGTMIATTVASALYSTSQQSQYDEPEIPNTIFENQPSTEETDAEAQSVRDEERRKILNRRLMGGTILSSPLGTTGGAGRGLLGRNSQ